MNSFLEDKMQKYKITMDNPDGSLETVWQKKTTE